MALHRNTFSQSEITRIMTLIQKVELAAGESQTVSFDITQDLLEYYDDQLRCAAELGEFNVFIGGDSTTGNKAVFTLEK